MAPDQQRNDDWALTTGGGMVARGVHGGLTGRPITGLGIIDDPVKDRAEAESPLIRETSWGWYSSVFLTRMAPHTAIVLILTRWHEDDLAGRVLKEEGTLADGGRWRYLNVPALADSPDDPLGRPIGAPMDHPRIGEGDTEALAAFWRDKRRSVSIRDWHALFQGDPQPVEGALVTSELLAARRHLNPQVRPLITAVAIDPSGGGRDTAGIIGGYLGTDQRLYLTDDCSGVMPSDQWARATCLLAQRIGADRIVCEVNFGSDMIILTIRTAWDTLLREGQVTGLAPRIVAVRSKKGKWLRAEPVAQQFIEDRVRLAAWLPELEGEWTSWQPTSNYSPGRIDASVHLALSLLPVPGRNTLVSTAAGRPKEPTGASHLARQRITR